MNPLRRGIRSFLDRYPRTSVAIGLLAVTTVVVADIGRVWHAPIAGAAVWRQGTEIGVGAAVTATAGWIWSVVRHARGTTINVWRWTSAIVLFVAFLATHHKYGAQPRIDNELLVGALWYEIASFGGILATVAILMITKNRMSSAPDVTNSVSEMRPRRSRRAKKQTSWR